MPQCCTLVLQPDARSIYFSLQILVFLCTPCGNISSITQLVAYACDVRLLVGRTETRMLVSAPPQSRGVHHFTNCFLPAYGSQCSARVVAHTKPNDLIQQAPMVYPPLSPPDST